MTWANNGGELAKHRCCDNVKRATVVPIRSAYGDVDEYSWQLDLVTYISWIIAFPLDPKKLFAKSPFWDQQTRSSSVYHLHYYVHCIPAAGRSQAMNCFLTWLLRCRETNLIRFSSILIWNKWFSSVKRLPLQAEICWHWGPSEYFFPSMNVPHT